MCMPHLFICTCLSYLTQLFTHCELLAHHHALLLTFFVILMFSSLHIFCFFSLAVLPLMFALV